MSDTSWDTLSATGGPLAVSSKVRVTVCFENGGSIVVPILPTALVSELMSQALLRAQGLGIECPTGDITIRAGVQDSPALFGEDAVEDCLDVMQNVVVWMTNSTRTLQALVRQPVVARPIAMRPATDQYNDDHIYVRWITAGRALDSRNLSEIQTDPSPVDKTTTIHTLKQLAINRVYRSPSADETSTVADFEVDLFLTPCALSTIDETITLEGLDRTGTLALPLNVYIVPRNYISAIESKPHTLWGFQCSDRGIATFNTCLKVLMSEIHNKSTVFRRLLKVLFEVTHFPPALEALHVLAIHNRLIPRAVHVLGYVFRELALRMVPGCLVGGRIDSVLEGSRQIFAWLFEQCGSPAEAMDDPQTALVRTIHFEELESDDMKYSAAPDERVEVVEFYAEGEALPEHFPNFDFENETSVQSQAAGPSGSASTRSTLRKVRIRVHVTCRENLRLLALALWGKYDQINNNYVDFRDNISAPFSHRRTPLVDAADFESLILVANRSPRFLMLSPIEITQRKAQGITMSKEGYVSLYSINIGHFKSFASQLENAITGVEALQGADPGKAILAALEPLIRQRKTAGTWEVDSWELRDEITKSTDESPDEAIVICVDLSASMQESMGDGWMETDDANTLTRLDETKQVFRNVIGRIIGNQLVETYVGLVTFGAEPQIETSLSRVRSEFKTKLENARADGCGTAIFDAISMAHEMLQTLKVHHPTTRLRIIALTDGEDNSSDKLPVEVCEALYDSNIVLDSIVIGTEETDDLFKISKYTGGYAFCPSSRLLLFQTFLLEPFLDISARPDIVRLSPPEDWEDWEEEEPKEPDMPNVYDFPPCRPHELENGTFISLESAVRFFTVKRPHSLLNESRSNENSGQKLIQRPLGVQRLGLSSGRIFLDELKYMVLHSHPSMDIYVNEADMSFWKIVMVGPAGSPYENGTFVMYVQMTPTYPQTPPNVRFITPILHPNITKHGRICHQILSNGWSPTSHIYNVMQHVFGLLTSPETDDAVDELATLKFWTDPATANAEIVKYVDKFAKRSRDAWKVDIERRESGVEDVAMKD